MEEEEEKRMGETEKRMRGERGGRGEEEEGRRMDGRKRWKSMGGMKGIGKGQRGKGKWRGERGEKGGEE